MRSAILNISLLIALSLSSDLSAHGGGTNSYGCHNQSSTSTHHCHSGDYNGLSFSSQDAFLAYVKEQSEQVPQTERDALVALYNSTDGANWRDNTGWLGEVGTECSWFGVECDVRNGLTQLSLPYNALRGTIPSELGNLTNLTKLNLRGNSLSGSIPSELGNLENLTHLELWANYSLGGSIPASLGNLTNLTYLSLLDNSLIGSIPVELGNLTNLTSLYLYGNSLSGSIPSELGNLTNLT